MCGFDQITAISQSAINSHFRSSRTRSEATSSATTVETLLGQWKLDECFEGTFKPVTVRLRSDGRAIVFIHLKEGFLHALRNWAPSSECVYL